MEIPEEDITRILIVDDDEDERELFTETLKKLKLPHVVYTASNCSGFLALLQQNPLPHVIFMDINMPLPNGMECLKKLKADKQYAGIPVLMYSISSAEQDIEEAYTAGAHYYVVKPYAPNNLRGTLKQAFKPDWRKPQPVPERSAFVIHLSFTD